MCVLYTIPLKFEKQQVCTYFKIIFPASFLIVKTRVLLIKFYVNLNKHIYKFLLKIERY